MSNGESTAVGMHHSTVFPSHAWHRLTKTKGNASTLQSDLGYGVCSGNFMTDL